MTALEVHGRDAAREAYRVSVGTGAERVEGYVAETLIAAPATLGQPRHQYAYEWLARNRRRIAAALLARKAGRPVRAPFDRVTLAEEH